MTVSTSTARSELPAESPGRTGMWIFLASDAMGFGGLLAAFIALRAGTSVWPATTRMNLGHGLLMTLLLLASSVSMSAAVAFARRSHAANPGTPNPQSRRVRAALVATVLLGLGFLLVQADEFQTLIRVDHLTPQTDHAAALFFIVTGYHGLHVLAGLAALLFVAAQKVDTTIETTGLYWQFVDVVWLVLFGTIYVPRGAVLAWVPVVAAVVLTLWGHMKLGRQHPGNRWALLGSLALSALMVAVLGFEFAARAARVLPGSP